MLQLFLASITVVIESSYAQLALVLRRSAFDIVPDHLHHGYLTQLLVWGVKVLKAIMVLKTQETSFFGIIPFFISGYQFGLRIHQINIGLVSELDDSILGRDYFGNMFSIRKLEALCNLAR
jgi:hypothetical protein